jgi:hypothetical protein
MIKQRTVLIWGLAAFALCGLFPPWLYTYDSPNTTGGYRSEKDAGYAFVGAPPTPDLRWLGQRDREQSAGIRLDFFRLIAEWISVAAITGSAWLLVGELENRLRR